MKILCVDDDLTVRTILKSGLSKNLNNDEILLAESGEKGVEIFTKENPEIVITDLNMPGMSGLELLKIVKDINIQTEVIVLTGFASIDSAVEAMKRGARDYLEKPVNIPILIEKVSNIKYLLQQNKSIEEYRFAKEMIENNASEDIARLEVAVDELKNTFDYINNILNSISDNSEKLNNIKKVLNEKTKSI